MICVRTELNAIAVVEVGGRRLTCTCVSAAARGGSAGLQCQACLKVYKNKLTLTRHQRYECGDKRPFACPLCTYSAKQKFQVKLHIKKKHKEFCYPDPTSSDSDHSLTR
ncbi:longitudinals lacking protein, isoforms A/B/D/L-like [Homalodisca vitripennis]|uniref:longitudinals lacking protein, isoforms A/B/D/L-like n=1 Tax=Homalodisca vitripennis TaxID=197043 RepID=UPI001EEBF870|nr:longitudinals lacking protein, isoforms A/B/D/L-like [Homalodisca vitripennis]